MRMKGVRSFLLNGLGWEGVSIGAGSHLWKQL